MSCAVEGCEVRPLSSRDSLCEPHWRALPRRYRCELIALRNGVRRHSKAAARDYAQAITAAVWLLTVGRAASQATSGRE